MSMCENNFDHKIPEDVLNSNIKYCVSEFVRIEEHQNLLLDRWFSGLGIKELADKYNLSETQVKRIVYGIGDKIILKATKM